LYYAWTLPMVLLPWFPLIPLYLWRRRGEGVLSAPIWRFVICWTTPGLILFWLSAFKKYHYVSPLLPGWTVLCAVALMDHLLRRHHSRRLHSGGFALLAIAGCAIGIAVVWRLQPRGALPTCWIIAALGASLLVMLWLESRRKLTAHLGAIMATCWLLIAAVFTYVMPKHDTYLDQSLLAQRINELVPAGETVYVLELPESQIVYYLERPIVRLDQTQGFLTALPEKHAGEYYVLGTQKAIGMLQQAGQMSVLDECPSLISYMQPTDRLTFGRLRRPADHVARQPAATPGEQQQR
jgi:4-amino-4-deoxy-L-arabinose transferase-like glycosyltransferase